MVVLRFSVIFPLLSQFSLSCVSRHQSQWHELNDLDDQVECKPWPLEKNEIQVTDVLPVEGKQPGFLVTSLTNNSRDNHYYLPFADSVDLAASPRTTLIFNKNIYVLGAGTYGDMVAAALLTDDDKGRKVVEIRDIRKNTVEGSVGIKDSDMTEGEAIFADRKVWANMYDGKNRLSLLDPNQKESGEKQFKDALDSDRVVLLQPQGGTYYAVAKVYEKKEQPAFKLIAFADGKSSVTTLPLQLKGDVEGWDAEFALDGSLYLAFVAGNSLIYDSKLAVAQLALKDAGPEIIREWSVDARGSYISKPVIKFDGADFSVFATRWLDKESMLTVYRPGEGGLAERSYGPLPEASSLSNIISGEDRDYFVLRYKKEGEDQLNYDLCGIDR